MKKMYTFKSWWIVGILLCVMGAFSSCLKSGDETIALQAGDANTLILGGWRVSQAQAYESDGHVYISDLPGNQLVGVMFNLLENGVGEMVEGDVKRSVSWSVSDTGNFYTLYLGNVTYDLISLGEKVMVLEMPYTLEGEAVILRYLLTRQTTAEGEAETPENATQTVSSGESAILNKGGIKLSIPEGAIPENDRGEAGKVAFSMQNIDELPAELPSGLTLVEGTGVKLEPMGFTFRSPLTLEMPLKGNAANEVGLYRYDEATGVWMLIPFSSVKDGNVSASVIDLGYFLLAKKASGVQTGGLFIDKKYFESGYFYYVTLIPQNGNSEGVKRIGFAANGEDLYMSNVPLGAYRLVISREHKAGWQEASSGSQYASNDIDISVTTPVQGGSGGFDSYTGWTELEQEDIAGGEFYWLDGRPDWAWGEETKTYGTGHFQATLTWVNVAGSTTDYDLHLTLPSGQDVYFAHKKEGAFELDRDWISDLGNATENIYCVSDEIPTGTYKVRIHHFNGTLGRRYNCRILVDGVVVKSVSGSISVNKQYDDIYSFTVE